jgi:hypothetical protein
MMTDPALWDIRILASGFVNDIALARFFVDVTCARLRGCAQSVGDVGVPGRRRRASPVVVARSGDLDELAQPLHRVSRRPGRWTTSGVLWMRGSPIVSGATPPFPER